MIHNTLLTIPYYEKLDYIDKNVARTRRSRFPNTNTGNERP